MQRAWRRAMDGREDELRHGLPARPTHRDALHAARGKLRAHDPTEPATPAASAERPTSTSRAPAPTPSTTASTRASARSRASRPSAGRAAEARQEEAAAPRPVRPRATSTTAAAGATSTAGAGAGATTTTGARAGPAGSGSASWVRRGGAAGVLPVPVHAVAAAEVGGDAEEARVLLRGVQVQLPDAGAGGHLQHRHGRQQAHHHLQRGEPQRLRHRLVLVLVRSVGRRGNWVLSRRAPAVRA